ncbi:MAG: NUDIX hydrolase [Balneolaceae bacterium]|nr:NUDIX hydrolase [Balneolaceae bacterium]MDR9408588.1 NUDIX hydrolase [Balneolaceae bacterium]
MSDSFSFTKPKWDIIKDKKLLETPIFSLYQRELIPDKETTPASFYVLDAPDWINILALTENREIVLVEQYRAGIDESSLEIPGGMVDEGESPMVSAKRELQEETGYQSKKWTKLGQTSANAAIMNNYTHIYLAEKCVKVDEQNLEGNEDIAVHILELDHFLELVKESTIHHSIVVAAVAHLLLHDKT